MFYLIYSFSRTLPLFMYILVFDLYTFPFLWRAYFIIFFARQFYWWDMHSVLFVSQCLYLAFIFEGWFIRFRILGQWFFYWHFIFNTWNICPILFFLAWFLKSDVVLFLVLLQVRFPLPVSPSFFQNSVFDFLQFEHDIRRCSGFFFDIYPGWSSLNFLDL